MPPPAPAVHQIPAKDARTARPAQHVDGRASTVRSMPLQQAHMHVVQEPMQAPCALAPRSMPHMQGLHSLRPLQQPTSAPAAPEAQVPMIKKRKRQPWRHHSAEHIASIQGVPQATTPIRTVDEMNFYTALLLEYDLPDGATYSHFEGFESFWNQQMVERGILILTDGKPVFTQDINFKEAHHLQTYHSNLANGRQRLAKQLFCGRAP